MRRPALPSEYQEVEYIESSGTQYLGVLNQFKTSYKVEIDFQMTQIGGDYIPIGIHYYNDGNTNIKYGIDAYNPNFNVNAGGNWTIIVAEDTNRHTIIIDKNTAIVDGTSYTINYVNYTFNDGIGVFAYHETHLSQYNYKSSNKLYKLDIYDENGNHIFDGIPCYRKSDSVIGLYDIVNGQFYTNAGSGTFTKGADVSTPTLKEKQVRPVLALPSAYQEVEYIESDRSVGQYIHTNIIPVSNTGLYFKASSQNITNDGVYVGAATNNSDTGYKYGLGGNRSTIYYGYNNWLKETYRPSSTLDTVFELELNYKNSGVFKKDGIIYTGDSATTIGTLTTIGYPLNIFGHNGAGTAQYFSSIKLYNLKVSSGSNIIADFVPCYRKSDSVIGVYDLVNNEFYSNAGSGTFTKGPDVN